MGIYALIVSVILLSWSSDMVELGINLPLLIAYLVTFVILLAILYQFAYKPLMAAMDQRSERIQEGLSLPSVRGKRQPVPRRRLKSN